MKERKSSIIGKISGEFLLNRTSIELIDPDNNLGIAREHLKSGSAIVIFNHFKGDFFLWARFIQENLTSLDNVTAWVAMKYLDPNRNLAGRTLSYMFPEWEKSHGVKVLPIVQKYDQTNYPDAKSINSVSFKKSLRLLKEPGKIVAIAPEGTRSKTGELSEAEEGIEVLIRMSKSSLAIPLAAEISNALEIKYYKNKTPIKIRVGKPFFIQDIEKDQKQNPQTAKKDLIMQRIAVLLPEQSRGYYI